MWGDQVSRTVNLPDDWEKITAIVKKLTQPQRVAI